MVVLWVGCTAPRGEPMRFIEEDPESVFVPKNLAESVSVFRWTFDRPEDLQPWQCAEITEECRVTEGVLRIRSSSPYPMLIRGVDLDAHQIHAIRVTAAGASDRLTRVFWAGPGETYADERRIDLIPIGETENLTIYEGSTASHALWRGHVTQLRLDFNPPAGQPVEIGGIEGIRYELGVERIAGMFERAWKVDIDNDVRNAFVTPPGYVIEREAVVPRAAELRFGIALLPGVRLGTEGAPTDVRFQVLLRRPGSPSVTIFDRTRALSEQREGSLWQDHVADLSDYAGESVHLALETSAGGVPNGIPVWANPEIVSTRQGSAPPNVVLISIDTLRADHLSLNGYSRPTSPRIDAWARRAGVNFREVIAPSPWTLPSHVSLFTGQDAIQHGVNHNFPIPPSVNLLAERLRDAGYATLAATGGGLLRPEYGFTQGFDSYRYWPSREFEEGELESGIERALGQIDRHAGGPFYLFFHSYEVHSPYRAREPFYGRFEPRRLEDPALQISHAVRRPSPEDGMRRRQEFVWRRSPMGEPEQLPTELQPVLVSLYDSGIAYTDELLSRLLERLGEPDLADRTIVILTSDHGESLGKHGRAAHYHLYDENLRVPLIVSYPSVLPGGRVVERQVRTVDILPTILDLAGLDLPIGIDGLSLRPLIEDDGEAQPREAWSYAARTNMGISLRGESSYKYIFNDSPWPPSGGTEELYHLSDDPEERENLVALDPALARSFRARVRKTLSLISGLWIQFSNDGEGSYTGELRGSIGDTRVKSMDAPAGALRWTLGAAPRFSVPAGTSYSLVFDEPVLAAVSVVGTWRGVHGEEVPFHWKIDPDTLTSPHSLALESTAWVEHVGDAKQGTRITAWWQGGRRGERLLPMDDSGALRRELEALGYLDR